MQERRHSERVEGRVVVTGRIASQALRAKLVELGAGGVRLRTVRPLIPGRTLELLGFRCPVRPALCCRVVWCARADRTGYLAGLECPEPVSQSWLGLRLGIARTHRRRAQCRLAPSGAVAVTVCAASSVTAGVLVDLGYGGAQLEVPIELSAGEQVRLRLGGVRLIASVVGARTVRERHLLHVSFSRGQRVAHQALSRILANIQGESKLASGCPCKPT